MTEYVDLLLKISGRTPRQVAAWFAARNLPAWDRAEDPPQPELWLGLVCTPPAPRPPVPEPVPGPWVATATARVWRTPLAARPDRQDYRDADDGDPDLETTPTAPEPVWEQTDEGAEELRECRSGRIA